MIKLNDGDREEEKILTKYTLIEHVFDRDVMIGYSETFVVLLVQ